MARRCRGVDWSRTPLGPTEDWSVTLRIAVRMVLESPFPIALWCGPSLTLIYNDGYGAVLGSKHPSALGRPGHAVWKEIWPTIEVMFRRGAAARTTYAENACFEMDRADGTLGEAWFTYAVSPIRDESGDIVAFLNPATETTSRVMVERELDRARETAERAERRIHDVFAQAPAFLAVLRGPEHRFEFANEAYRRLVGHRTIIDQPVADALPEVREQGFIDLLDQVYSTGSPFVGRAIPVMLERLHGEPPQQVYVDFVYQPLTGADGSIEGIVAHGSDVTDAVTARTVIEENASQYRFLADSIPVQVWTATTDGLLDYVNLRAETYFGAPASALIGTGWQSYVHREDLELAGARCAHSLSTGAPYEVEFRLRGAEGEYRWHLARGTAQRSTDGDVLRWFGTNTDIEEAKRNEAELQRLTMEATEANRAKSDFLAAMSHELRTPLNAIGGYAQLIEMGVRGPVTDAMVEDLRKIQRSKEHLNTLVGGVLAFAKGGTGRIELQTRNVGVDSLLRSVLDMIAPQLAERELILDPVEGNRDFVLRADEDKARQVLLNVLANALKFTPTGGHITITVTRVGPVGLIAVRDTGIGVASEQLEAIFEPFVQAGSALQSRDSGVGLGLAISRQLARAMGGDLTVESVQGSGSTFTLELPVRA
ncbi:MAG: PAS domain-containing protein [Gemmatimonadaceae bacterium]|nr:PAS domain-containing protein [Gemmatimonadaceae bacterium]